MPKAHKYTRVSEFTIVVLCMWIVCGALVFAGGFSTEWSPEASLKRLPNHFEFPIGALISVGGFNALRGALLSRKILSERWTLEITGLILGGFGWFMVSVAALALAPATPFPYVVGFFMSGAAIWRTWGIWMVASNTRKKVQGSDEC